MDTNKNVFLILLKTESHFNRKWIQFKNLYCRINQLIKCCYSKYCLGLGFEEINY